MEFEIVLATDHGNGIGIVPLDEKSSTIPWKIAEDMKFFREITSKSDHESKQNAIIMGRITADTIPKALPKRLNVVITSRPNYRDSEGFLSYGSLDDALNQLKSRGDVDKVFVIGGSVLCDDAIKHRMCRGVYLNRIDYDYKCDVVLSQEFMSRLGTHFEVVDRSIHKCLCKIRNTDVLVTFHHLIYVNREEITYLNMLDHIIRDGDFRDTRNAKTYSDFGEKLVFDLDNGFPLLTTKKMFHRGIFEELLFFLRGDTDTRLLEDKKVMIWHGNTTKEFMEKYNKNLEEYDMGPMYGFQWRHFGAEYKGCHHDYTGEGVDQLEQVINLLVKDPNSRRIVLTTFNPVQAEEGVLYPCHGLTVQFYVEKNNRISLQMYQRSMDSILGAPFNIASYALFLIIVTELVNNNKDRTHKNDYRPGRVIIVTGDTHIYSDTKSDHILTAKEQISRRYRTHPFPEVKLKKRIATLNDLNTLTTDDIEIKNYISEPALKAEMYE